jgi:hypothetical protein
MRKEIIIPQGDGESHPFFRSLPFTYRASYFTAGNRTRNIEYLSPHEIILNLKSFKPDDTITYVNRDTGKDVFRISFDKFNLMLAESMLDASPGNLELLYGRLLLTNQFSKSIADKGRLKYFDQILRKYLLTLKGGIDSYLAYENRKVILYLKYRRTSVHHLTTIIQSKMEENDIHFYHINIPSSTLDEKLTLPNQGLLVELLRMDIARSKFRIYSYDPVPEEDNIISTDISREIIQVINQLIN